MSGWEVDYYSSQIDMMIAYCIISLLKVTSYKKYLLGGLYKCLVGVDRVSGHGDDGAVELGEVIHPVGEGGEALSVDKVHRVEHQADILLT